MTQMQLYPWLMFWHQSYQLLCLEFITHALCLICILLHLHYVSFTFCLICILSGLHFVSFAFCLICILLYLQYVGFAFCQICILSFFCILSVCILSNLHFVWIPNQGSLGYLPRIRELVQRQYDLFQKYFRTAQHRKIFAQLSASHMQLITILLVKDFQLTLIDFCYAQTQTQRLNANRFMQSYFKKSPNGGSAGLLILLHGGPLKCFLLSPKMLQEVGG